MASYYYLAAQLPYLFYGQTPPMSSEAFKELAKPLLSKRDSALLDLVSLDPLRPTQNDTAMDDGTGKAPSYLSKAPSCGSDFIDRWREWERVLRLNLAKHRAAKLGRPGLEEIIPEEPVEAAMAAEKAIESAVSPHELEIQLDKARWHAIEELQGNDYFDHNTIFAYLLKLYILERRASFQAEKGYAEYKSLYASILDSVQSRALASGESI